MKIKDELYKITLLGEFVIETESAKISDQMNYSRKLWALLAFLLLNRDKEINNEKLVEMLWDEGASGGNPLNTLKTQISRIRSMLKPLSNSGQDMIMTGKNRYYWNPDLKIEVDLEKFGELVSQRLKLKYKRIDDIKKLEEALQLYRGEFLPRIQLDWVDGIRNKYLEEYIASVLIVRDYYEKESRWEDSARLAERALQEAPLHEKLNLAYLRALLHLGKQEEARMHYEDLNEMYIKELNDYPTKALQELYRDIMQLQQQITTDLTAIQQKLKRLDVNQGAFVCDYAIFREAYFLEVRRAERTDERIFLGLITVSSNKKLSSEVEDKRLSTVMRQLLYVLKNNLRRGDVISQYSRNQYVLLLPTQTYENGIMVMNRLISLFYKRNKRNDVILHCNLQPIKSRASDSYNSTSS